MACNRSNGPWIAWVAVSAWLLAGLVGCSSLPPGAHFPKTPSRVQLSPQDTRLGTQFQAAATAHANQSGFRIISVGVDGFLARIEMIKAAERTLDLQYYIFRGDETGSLIRDALQRAAQRGVHVRILVDDADTRPGDERLFSLANVPNVEIRVYNPWAYRGHVRFIRNLEFLTHRSRLDYRMHNKLLVVDDAIALVGGRNLGDQYFQIDPQSQFADDDVFVTGPTVPDLERHFDEFWNSDLAIPSTALDRPKSSDRDEQAQPRPHLHDSVLKNAGFHYDEKLASGEPLASILSGRMELTWASAQIVCDSPDKKEVDNGVRVGRLNYKPIAEAAASTQRELLITTPYFVPSKGELRILHDGRNRGVRIAVLTNSLQSTPELSAHAGYMHYRPPLLQQGVELYEVRSKLESVRGSGQSKRVSDYGNYALHGKLLVFDRRELYIGSMNFDRRSRYLNTEIGLLINSPELSQQMAARFTAMSQLESAYTVVAQTRPNGRSVRLTWKTKDDGHVVEYDEEPARSWWQRMKVKFLTLLPLDPEL